MSEEEKKNIFKSKTFWFNTLSIAGTVLSGGTLPLSPEVVTIGIAAVNLGLRLVTKEPVKVPGVG